MSNNRPTWWVGTLAALLVVALVPSGQSLSRDRRSDEAACPPSRNIPTGPLLVIGTRCSWTPFVATSLRPRFMPETSITPRRPCGTRGLPTTRTRTGVFVDEDQSASTCRRPARKPSAMPRSAVLEARYLDSIGATDTIPELDRLMADLCYPTDVTTTEGDSPAALGNRIADVDTRSGDGRRLQRGRGICLSWLRPRQSAAQRRRLRDHADRPEPMATAPDPAHDFAERHRARERCPGSPSIRTGATSSGFALPPAGESGVPIDPGDPPYVHDPATDQEYKDAAVEVVGYSSLLDPTFGVMVDISPATLGDNPLGTNDGAGYDVNPATGAPYEPNVVNEGDFGRTVAEFWADGPDSETPPGHWNTVANAATEELGENLRIGGTGGSVDALEWDVKLYLALNGANHDAAIAAWGRQGPLRLHPSDFDDSLDGRQRSIE